ncbi:shikimate kinase [Candidatus Pelagibacter sp. Uisw_092]|uniref:shikimate kinase n=1 Tax=Candidatus Pelagibacter sp. Uisw_092 TaxID=3230979 RepID=UPI0039ECAA19
MNSKKNLIFLGMMGSGKSSIGHLVSKKLKIPFIDIDNLIEEHASMTVAKIFEINGEDYFRGLEEKITLKSLKNKKNVISLGGGSFINDNIRKDIVANHFSFWLDWDDLVLVKRIKGNKKRPLAFKSTDKEILAMIAKRKKIYSKANFKINCNKLTKNEIVKKIIKIYELN